MSPLRFTLSFILNPSGASECQELGRAKTVGEGSFGFNLVCCQHQLGAPQCRATAVCCTFPPLSPPFSFPGGWDAEDVTQPGSVKGEALLGGLTQDWGVGRSSWETEDVLSRCMRRKSWLLFVWF